MEQDREDKLREIAERAERILEGSPEGDDRTVGRLFSDVMHLLAMLEVQLNAGAGPNGADKARQFSSAVRESFTAEQRHLFQGASLALDDDRDPPCLIVKVQDGRIADRINGHLTPQLEQIAEQVMGCEHRVIAEVA